jgi:hypothetical protein
MAGFVRGDFVKLQRFCRCEPACEHGSRNDNLTQTRQSRNNPPPRHCERSVAIHAFVRRLSWIASFLAMTGLERTGPGCKVKQSTARHCERSVAIHAFVRRL